MMFGKSLVRLKRDIVNNGDDFFNFMGGFGNILHRLHEMLNFGLALFRSVAGGVFQAQPARAM